MFRERNSEELRRQLGKFMREKLFQKLGTPLII